MTKHARHSRPAPVHGRHAMRQRPSGKRPNQGHHGRRRSSVGRSVLLDVSLFLPLALLAAWAVKAFLGQAYSVPSESMSPTLVGAGTGGDRVLVNKIGTRFGQRPERGQILVFRDELGWLDRGGPERGPSAPAPGPTQADAGGFTGLIEGIAARTGLVSSGEDRNLVKRVIAVGGDRVTCARHRLYVNGLRLVEDEYLHPRVRPCVRAYSLQVPQGRLFVLGDNRQHSGDSGFHRDGPYNGTVSETTVIGPAVAVALPFSRAHGLPLPEAFSDPVGALGRFSTPV
jgi:signal peptidase I